MIQTYGINTTTIENVPHIQDIDTRSFAFHTTKLINIEIANCHSNLTKTNHVLKTLRSDIIILTNELAFNNFLYRQNKKAKKLFHKIKSNNKKLDKLVTQKTDNDIRTGSGWIRNLSNVDIQTDILRFISLGPNRISA